MDGLENGDGITITSDGRHLYVTGFDDNALAIFARDAESGGLAFVGFVRGSE